MDNASITLQTLDSYLHHPTPQIEGAFAEAVIPDLIELREAFECAKPRVRKLALQGGVEN